MAKVFIRRAEPVPPLVEGAAVIKSLPYDH
jgi:hypothetical protein